jgi:hypothetical protein
LKAGGSVRTSAFYIATVLLLLSASLAHGAIVQVSSNLQAAIDAASPGDTLLVAPGVYGGITVAKSLNLEGQGAVIAADERDACVRILADGVKVSGFVVRNGFYGISLDEVENCGYPIPLSPSSGIMLKFSNNNIVKTTMQLQRSPARLVQHIPDQLSDNLIQEMWPAIMASTASTSSPPAATTRLWAT